MEPLKQSARKHDQRNNYTLLLPTAKVNRIQPIIEYAMAALALLIFVLVNIQNSHLL